LFLSFPTADSLPSDTELLLRNRRPLFLSPSSSLKRAQVVREIQEFVSEETNLTPQLSYIHHLYVYPQAINYNNYSGNVKHRNLCVNVRFKENDYDINAPGLKVCTLGYLLVGIFFPLNLNTWKFYLRVLCCLSLSLVAYLRQEFIQQLRDRSMSLHLNILCLMEKNFRVTDLLQMNTAVMYHEKKPYFLDEIKIDLPNVLTPRHHILFQINHIVCQVSPLLLSTCSLA
jgi:hypothetical protein